MLVDGRSLGTTLFLAATLVPTDPVLGTNCASRGQATTSR
jgi:NhaP-type Na+/H+ or K+/H+ antiporter